MGRQAVATQSCLGLDLRKLRHGLDDDLNVRDRQKTLNAFQQKAIDCYNNKNNSKAMVEKRLRCEEVNRYKREAWAIDNAATFRRGKFLAVELERQRGIRVEKNGYSTKEVRQKYHGLLTGDLPEGFD